MATAKKTPTQARADNDDGPDNDHVASDSDDELGRRRLTSP